MFVVGWDFVIMLIIFFLLDIIIFVVWCRHEKHTSDLLELSMKSTIDSLQKEITTRRKCEDFINLRIKKNLETLKTALDNPEMSKKDKDNVYKMVCKEIKEIDNFYSDIDK